jgi:hypothetical protein
MKPLFIPLKTEFYTAFAYGLKDTEYRLYGPRWNEKTCPIGRPVILSHGYGRRRRLAGVIVGFERRIEPTTTEDWRRCYGDRSGEAACIRIMITADLSSLPFVNCRCLSVPFPPP